MADAEPQIGRQTRAPGNRSRARLADQAARLATVQGLEGLSIGRLAEAAGVPKSSVYALFGSKEELQLATISAAREHFIAEVVSPARWPPAHQDENACWRSATATCHMLNGGSSPEAASSSPHPRKSAHAPGVSVTR